MTNTSDDKPQIAEWADGSIDREKIFLAKLGFKSRESAYSALNVYSVLATGGEAMCIGSDRSYKNGEYFSYLRDCCGLSKENAAKLITYATKKYASGDKAARQMLKDRFGIKVCDKF
jgi:hypothetical protein